VKRDYATVNQFEEMRQLAKKTMFNLMDGKTDHHISNAMRNQGLFFLKCYQVEISWNRELAAAQRAVDENAKPKQIKGRVMPRLSA
jgi:hypothetical protein